MGHRKLSDNAAAILVAVLLLLTALGNAYLLFAVAGLVLVGLLLLFRSNLRDAALPAIAAALVGVAVALAMILLLRR